MYSSNINVVPGGTNTYQLLDSSLLDSFDIQHQSDGFFARAYVDVSQGNVIISYEGSIPSFASVIAPNQSYDSELTAADEALLIGQSPQALQDAVDFAQYVWAAAITQGYGTDPIYVTGHSLGGTEAEAAALALNTSVAGGFISGSVTFAATGLPGYLSPGGNNNFLNFVDTGDPVGNYANDSLSELRSISKTGSHFGTVQLVGTAYGAASLGLALDIARNDEVAGVGAFLALAQQYHLLCNYYVDLKTIYPEIQIDRPVLISTGTTITNPAPTTANPNLAYLLAGQSASIPPQQNANPEPVVDNPSNAPVLTESLTPVSNWFSTSETNSGGNHSITGYNLFVVRGSGSLIVDGLPYSLGSVAKNISPAEFATAYFDAGPTPGVSEIAVIAIDDLGDYSVAGDMTITVTAPATSPQPIVTSDHTPPTIVAPSQQLVIGVGSNPDLTSAYLQVTDANSADYTPAQLTYTITAKPQDGYILMGGSIVSSFTQQDIDDNLVEYQENGTVASSDSFTYYVSDPAGNQTPSTTFNISINAPPVSTHPALTTNTALSVGQGGTQLITDSNLDVSDAGLNSWQIIYTVTSGPADGQILADGINPVTYFTQQQVDLGLVSYKNKGASSGQDNFDFTVSDSQGGTIGQTVFDVNVIPKNNLSVKVERPLSSYEGPNNFVIPGTNTPPSYGIVGPDVLSAVDAGVDPQNITYTVDSVPANARGFLVGTWNGSGQFTGTAPATTFTQAEVDVGEVFYASPQGSDISGDQVTVVLSASDNAGNSVSNIVLPVILYPVGLLSEGQFTPTNQVVAATLPLQVPVGQPTVIGPGLITYLSPWYSSAQIEYALEFSPRNGTLYLNGQPLEVNYPFNAGSTQVFTQQDINEGHLTYVENGPSATPDEFGLFVADPFYGLNDPFGFTVSVTTTGTAGGQTLTGTSGAEVLSPGSGNNYLVGDGNTTASYANSPNAVTVDLVTGTVSNGYGGTDTLTNIHSFIGSTYDDTFEGTASQLNGDTITDFARGDKIIVTDANFALFSYSVTGTTLSFDPDSSISTTLDALTLTNTPMDELKAVADPTGGVDLFLAPTLSITSTGGLTNQTTQMISGTIDVADAGLTVSIFDGTTLLGTVTPAADGDWSTQVTLLSTQRTQAITAQATDAAGNVGSSGPVTFTLGSGTTVSSGQAYTISGETDIGVIVLSGGTLDVLYGGTAETPTVSSGGVQYVYSGGAASATNVVSGGIEEIFASGTDSGGTVSSGGVEYDLGTASGVAVSGGRQFVYGSAAATSLGNGGVEEIFAGGTDSGTIVSSGGSEYDFGTAGGDTLSGGGVQYVESAATATATTLVSGGIEDILAGGTDSGAIVSSGGSEYDFGTASGDTLSRGGVQFVYSGGAASAATLASGGIEDILSGGTASGGIVSSGGTQFDFGTASGGTLSSGGVQFVYSGGAASAATLVSGGIEDILAGGAANGAIVSSGGTQFDFGTASGGTLSGGVQYVYASAAATVLAGGGIEDILSGGRASGGVVSSGGTQFDFGTASGGTLSNGGLQFVYGSAANTTIGSGGIQDILSGGRASGGTVSSGGTEFDFGTASGGIVSSGGTEFDFATASGVALSGGLQYVYGSAAATVLVSGGLQDILSGGTASGGTVSSGGTEFDFGTASGVALSGGLQYVYGSAAAATIASGGIEDIIAGGAASGVTVSGGHQYVYGSAAATTLSSGGHEIVYSGGTISGATIAGGSLELQSGAAAGSSTIGFVSSGTLKLDGTGSYAMLVAGFTVPDAIDLTAVNYASATTLSYTSNTSGGTLTVTDGTHSVSLLLIGNYTAGSFSLSSGSTGTVVSDPPTGVTTDLTPVALVTPHNT